METILFAENIKCGGCAHTVRKTVEQDPKVTAVTVDPDTGKITIQSNEPLDESLLAERLRKKGYAAVGESTWRDRAVSYVSCMIGRVAKTGEAV